MDVSKEINKAMIDAGINQTELAKKLNTTQSNLSKILGRNNLNVKQMEAISSALGCELIIKFKIRNDDNEKNK